SRCSADDPKSAAAQNVVRQAKVHDVENVEELGAKFDCRKFGISAMTHGRVLNQRKIEVVKRRPAERVASQSSEPALVWACSARNVNRNGKERRVVVAS